METRTSTELKKILEIMEADKRDVAQQMKAMQDQIQELLLSNNHRTNGDSSSSGDSVNKEGNGSRHSNDIKVDIPEYDGKLDPDEFVEWLRTVELVFDYKQTTEDNKVKIVALKLRKSFAYFSVLFAVHVVGIMTFLLGAFPPLLLKDPGGVFTIMTIVSGSMAVLASGILILANLLLPSWIKDVHYTLPKTMGSISKIALPSL
ncbi:hypothetical protein Tco_0909383 [Tanacetum coccineum]|uniref:Uncharacterized protein n=1 Tax=Tanacetum coccineum TaxID=301880 RepID=A0ABQ5CQD2_9ASTR